MSKRSKQRNAEHERRRRARRKAEDPVGYAAKMREKARAYRASHPRPVRSNDKWGLISNAKRKEKRALRSAEREVYELAHATEIAEDKARTEAERDERRRQARRDHKKRWRKRYPEKFRVARMREYKRRTARIRAARIAEHGDMKEVFAERRRQRKRRKRAMYRARKKGALGKPSKGIISRLRGLQKGLCVGCRNALSESYHLDHVVALSKGGTNDDGNLQLLCQQCNSLKRDRDPTDFMQSRGYLI